MLSAWQSWLDKQRKNCNKFRWNSCVQPAKAASTESAFTEQTNWTPGSLHQSLPRCLFGNFRSERNINDELEQSFLKLFLKEHGLYNKHQTIQQRRRLKYLLELERRTTLLLGEEPIDGSIMQSDTGPRTCLIELHSMPFHELHADSKLLNPSPVQSPKLRRGCSLSALASATDPNGNSSSDEVTVSLSSITQEVKDTANPKCLKTVSWETSSSSVTKTLLETAV
ncbi:uncharacterized protein LOC128714970 [Anopheles marshallii]|uniref:uncharacterized protein LOC128714970 n=1 Tax=Anopheles marshallii TaxID=1521116 RepID=UPI00237B8D79|nr:uncharacterized protein LOC128714970 [Anopheles marshallii]